MPNVLRNNLDIHYTVSGEGPPVILGHSFLCSGEMWAPQEALLAQNYRVINADARGHGSSGNAIDAFTLYDMVGDSLAVLDHLGIERATWVGLSVGGMVALRAALTAPQRVDALILLDTDAGEEARWNRLKYSVMGFIARTIGIQVLLPLVARQMFGKTTRRCKPELVAEWRKRFSQVHIPSTLRMLKALQDRDDIVGQLPEITVPTLVLAGKEDRSLPPNLSRIIAHGVPGAKLVEIEKAGHLSTLEQPKAVNTAMIQFLNS